MFVLDSAKRDGVHLPPPEWDPPGEHSVTPPEAQQVEAASGSVLLYDARMWHRQHVNRSDHSRAAMLNALTPGWIVPQFDQSEFFATFEALCSESPDFVGQFTARERRDAEQLMRTVTGSGELLGAVEAGRGMGDVQAFGSKL